MREPFLICEPKAHSRLGFSGLARYSKCPGSIRLLAKLLRAPGDAASEGTAAHALAEHCLKTDTPPFYYTDEIIRDGARDWPVTLEMVDAVCAFLDEVQRHAGELRVEMAVCASSVSDELWGTADAVRITPGLGDNEPGTLRIYDFKYGVGYSVDARDNPQLMGYAVATLDTLGLWDAVSLVGCYIIQPRDARNPEPVRKFYVSVERLAEWRDTFLRPAVDAALRDDAPLIPGEQCGMFCDAALTCPAARRVVEEAVALVAPQNMDAADLGAWLTKAAAAKALFRAAEMEVERRLTSGGSVPGWKVVQGKGNRTWTDGAEKQLRDRLGDAIYSAPTLRSPAQVEKLGADAKALVSSLAYSPPGAPKIVPEDHKGTAVAPRKAADIFAAERSF